MTHCMLTIALLLGISCATLSQNSHNNYQGEAWEQVNGSGKIIENITSLKPFSNIEINQMNVKVAIETGAENYSMQVRIDDNLKDFFKWTEDGKKLKLYFDLSGGKDRRWVSSNNTVITIKAPKVESLANRGNCNIDVNLKNQDAFSLVTNGNPDININGKTTDVLLQTVGNPDINAGNLLAKKVTLSTNGNADIIVNASELIKKEVKGNNDIKNLFYDTAKFNKKNEAVLPAGEIECINFSLKNNSLLPKKITLISYRPDESGNGTNGFLMLSFGAKSCCFPVGTKLYLANASQVNTVMSGATISSQTPFLIVKKGDSGKSFNIN